MAPQTQARPDPALETHPVAAAAERMLAQCAGLLAQISDEVYARPSQRFFGSTIGQHVRHSLDHVSAALAGARDEVIDYDTRQRGVTLERERATALDAIDAVRAELLAVCDSNAARPVRVRVMLTSQGQCATLASTLARELAFAAHHEVHHHAMIASIAAEYGVSTPAGFGKAPATLNHEQHTR